MLLELPDGNWIDPNSVQGIRILDDRELGPRIVIDAFGQHCLYLIRFDDIEAARGWLKKFGAECNLLLHHVQSDRG